MEFKKTKIAITAMLMFGNVAVHDVPSSGFIEDEAGFGFVSDIFASKYSWGISAVLASSDCEATQGGGCLSGNVVVIVGQHINGAFAEFVASHNITPPKLSPDEYDANGGTSSSTSADGIGTEDECAGNPIMIASGNKIQYEDDYIGKGEYPLNIKRTYNLAWKGTGVFGEKWISNFGRKLKFVYASNCSVDPDILPTASCLEDGDNSKTPKGIVAYQPDGRKILFTYDGASEQWHDNKPESSRSLQLYGMGEWRLKTEDEYEELYSATGAILKRTNPRGISHTYAYVANQLTTITHSSGRKLTFVFNNGKVTKITDPAGNNYRYEYGLSFGGKDKLVKATRPGSPVVVREYGYYYSNDGILGSIDINGTQYAQFGIANNKGFSTEHAGGVDKFTFVYGTGYTKVTNPLGQESTYNYQTINGRKKLVKVDRAATANCPFASNSITYTSEGYVKTKIDWKGNVTDYDYALNGQLSKKITAAGTYLAETSTYQWVAGENKIARRANADLQTDYTYNADGRVETITTKDLLASSVAVQIAIVSFPNLFIIRFRDFMMNLPHSHHNYFLLYQIKI